MNKQRLVKIRRLEIVLESLEEWARQRPDDESYPIKIRDNEIYIYLLKDPARKKQMICHKAHLSSIHFSSIEYLKELIQSYKSELQKEEVEYTVLGFLKVGEKFELCRTKEHYTMVSIERKKPYGYHRQAVDSLGKLHDFHHMCKVRRLKS